MRGVISFCRGAKQTLCSSRGQPPLRPHWGGMGNSFSHKLVFHRYAKEIPDLAYPVLWCCQPRGSNWGRWVLGHHTCKKQMQNKCIQDLHPSCSVLPMFICTLQTTVDVGDIRDLIRISILPIFMDSSACPKLSTLAKMAYNCVKWPKMVILLTISNDNYPSKKMGRRVAS